ncbi:MAG: hypothetical protein ACUVUR_01765 [bacterium]
MELIVILSLTCALPLELVPEWQLTPDDEEVYEMFEDSLIETERLIPLRKTEHRLLWRLRADSLTGRFENLASFIRLNLLNQNQEAVVILEKDAGEKELTDFWGGGFSFLLGDWHLTFGDFLFHFGRGLLFSAPYVRSGFNQTDLTKETGSLARSAQENRNLRGLRFDKRSGRFVFNVIGSYSLRDASLNPDGTIARLRFSGLHRDSVSLKEMARAGQALVGLAVRMAVNNNLEVGAASQGIRYDRRFAPTDSVYSFSGQNLAGTSVFFVIGTKNRTGEVEIAHSFPGSIAGAIRLSVNEAGVKSAISGSVYQARFFSPAGRGYALSNRLARAEFSFQVGYERAGFLVGLDGNSYRDYLTDSIPARLEFKTGYETKPIGVKLILGRRFLSQTQCFRNSRVMIDAGGRVVKLRLMLGDEYPVVVFPQSRLIRCGRIGTTIGASSIARGRLVWLNISGRIKHFDIAATGAMLGIEGQGITICLPESGVMRLGTSFSSSESAQRLSITGALRIRKWGRVGAKVGFTHRKGWEPDFGTQVEVMNQK